MDYGPKERNRPYDTSEPDTLGAVISKLFAARGFGRVQADRQLHAAWSQTAGEDLARQTRVLNLKNGVMQIGVANSALLNELVSFRKQELLERIQANHSHLKLRDLKFKLRGDLLGS
ncbi:DUF721 domain-containing protein [Planctomicrobium sp. SH661]|uniref:DUF721 domain-containing protein n=1 Tax=Planctomicrobium sp. SH661 TaxID=3448124 RepID=UPI003F5C9AFD